VTSIVTRFYYVIYHVILSELSSPKYAKKNLLSDTWKCIFVKSTSRAGFIILQETQNKLREDLFETTRYNLFIYNFAELASIILESGTHPYIIKTLIVPEMYDIQSPILKFLTWPIWIRYNRILPREMHDPNFFRIKLVGILKNLIKMFFILGADPLARISITASG